MKAVLELEYDGSRFSGWQCQPGKTTVQGELERAALVFLRAMAKQAGICAPSSLFIQGSGRTDAGVHARGQVASFAWPEGISFSEQRLRRAFNALTPDGLTVREVRLTCDDFDARHSPHIKCYCYHLFDGLEKGGVLAGRAWHLRGELNVAEMIRAARMLEGCHDFSAFRAGDCNAKTTVRTVAVSDLSRVSRHYLVYTIHGTGFLKHMVRIIVGTLVEIGRGRRPSAEMAEILKSGSRQRAGITAPPDGLVLEWVKYGRFAHEK